MIKLVECPRDAMQGIKPFIETERKARYINQLLKVGFHTIDFGSFVSPKAIPQMKDTAQVLGRLERSGSDTKLLAIVANRRGADDAVVFDEIDYLGYPFSISETFQLRNTHASIEESIGRVMEIRDICARKKKEMVVYISMGFGNPYGDPWNVEIVHKWVDRLVAMDIGILQLSDTIGVANPANISYLFSHLIPQYPDTEFGAHFHTTPGTWREKIETAYKHGCRRFDGAIKGYGGCPMAKDDLTGNMPTERMIEYFLENNVPGFQISATAFQASMSMAMEVFP